MRGSDRREVRSRRAANVEEETGLARGADGPWRMKPLKGEAQERSGMK
jgi:hypothetical protein